MNLKKPKKEHKGMSFKRFLASFKCAWAGLVYAYSNEQSLWLHGIGSIVIIILGIIFKIGFYKWAVLILAIIVVLTAELLNTAIEATVDLVTKKFHPLAKVAKDCGAAAGGITGITLLIISLYIFLPYVIALFK